VSGHRDFQVTAVRSKPARFLSIDEIDFRFRKYDGSMSDLLTHEVMGRGDSVAVLAHDRGAELVILVEQFRIATVGLGVPGEGWLTEIPAGSIEQGETPREAARRELKQETGYDISAPSQLEDLAKLERFELIGTIYPSAGGTNERIFLFYVEVTHTDRVNEGVSLSFQSVRWYHFNEVCSPRCNCNL
jgi:ADP-ribose pyrophosphatase